MKCPACGSKARKVKRDYRYIESGLDNIILKNIIVHECSCGEVMPEIKHVEGLHKAILYALAKKPGTLNGKELCFMRKQMGLKAKELAVILGVTDITVSRWENMKSPIGIESDKLMRLLCTQYLEEMCGVVFMGTVAAVKAVSPSVKQRPIEIKPEEWRNLCGSAVA